MFPKLVLKLSKAQNLYFYEFLMTFYYFLGDFGFLVLLDLSAALDTIDLTRGSLKHYVGINSIALEWFRFF